MKKHRQMLKKPSETAAEYFTTLRNIGLTQFVQKAEPYAGDI
jgi:hypothetical protein